ncbi:myogenesis-regulating glycosidase-like isoform X2 [Vespa mandarinia]|uniref:myogenesis-regulating glycosidase-like isoform X2 n=1 Tax=Vespa mandarinia TaxID=7446 RepID=UPI001612FB55|nr:myogenesis-regulating glycosidase-like isoform X2 [Vespa mandarinia]
MKLLWRNRLFLLLNIILIHKSQCELRSKIERNIRNAVVTIEINQNVATLRICRNSDGEDSCTRNVLHTQSSDILRGPTLIDLNCGTDNVCLKNEDVIHTVIRLSTNSDVINVSRIVKDSDAKLIDCYELGDDTEWFGGPQLRYQHWPIQHMYYEEEPYVPTHPVNMAVAERYWLSGKGTYIYVDMKDPLFLDQNNYMDKYICLVSKNKGPYRHRESITLNYEIGIFSNPRVAHEYVVQNHLGKPTGHPNERMIKHPIWSTWARYKVNVSESVIENFAIDIIEHGFNNSQLEIDDNWETCYGSAEFDKSKFPIIARLTEKLKYRDFRVTLWIHPFINKNCEPAYSTALNNSYFVKSTTGKVDMQWWQGTESATIDFTNPKAVDWWVARLKLLEEIGIDSFKFDAGEVSWLPQIPSLNGSLDTQPGIFTKDYVTALANNFDDNIEVRVGWRSQDLPIFVRMIDKDSTWSWNNGLPTLITTLLQMNLNGYVFVLPDMIGGNGYLNGALNGTVYPPKELFIRWLQANVFMPSLQYSFVPWDFDNETVEICKKYTDLHADITPLILDRMNECIKTGAPLNPPIWWVDPTDKTAHKIKDEYLLGEEILVAPVIEEGAVSRDIYLPKGLWKDASDNVTYIGPGWIRNYDAPLDKLPYFYRV